jgi:nucleotide-binding universal stress UspA family protein
VVIMTRQDQENRRIVVGVDGSPSSTVALRWAIHQAKLTGSEVEAVIVWRMPTAYDIAPIAPGAVDRERDAEELLDKVLAEFIAVEPDVVIRPTVVQGFAGNELVHAARGAELLVVGSRGHSGLAGTLLGSASQYCAHHAPCPVLIMRPDTEAGHGQLYRRDRRRGRRVPRQ